MNIPFLWSTILFTWLILTSIYYVVYCLLYKYWSKRRIFQVKPNFPFGNVAAFFMGKSDFGTMLKKFYDLTSEDCVGFYMFFRPAILIRNLTYVQHILSKDFDHFNARAQFSYKKCPLMYNMFTTSGEKWKKERKLLAPAFTIDNLKPMCETIYMANSSLDHYLHGLSKLECNAVGIHNLIERHMFNVIASVAFGINIDTITFPEERFRIFGERCFSSKYRYLVTFLKNYVIPESWQKLMNISEIDKKTEKFFLRLTKNTIKYREGLRFSKDDYMELLIKLRNRGFLEQNENRIQNYLVHESRKKLSIEEVSAQAFLFLISGFDTMVKTLSFCLYELALDANIQKKARAEIDTVLKDVNNIGYEHIEKMDYLDCCITETLRKYPVSSMLVRVCTKEYLLPTFRPVLLKKNTPVFISLLGIHHDPKNYADPLKFKPERFNSKYTSVYNRYAFLSYGEGPRNCLGTDLSKLIMKYTLVCILSKYYLRIGPQKNYTINFEDPGFINESLKLNMTIIARD